MTLVTQVATGELTVKLPPLPFEDRPPGSRLERMSLFKRITGDLDAVARGQMLVTLTARFDSQGYVAVEHVDGLLAGKRGTFVLQHFGVMSRGAHRIVAGVVPDSGTDDLVGLAGTFSMQLEPFNPNSYTVVSLACRAHRYEFKYTLPSA